MRNPSKISHKTLVCSVLTIGAFNLSFSFAADGIATDGSVGALQNLTGTQVNIPQALGTTVGANLFHSFADFNIQTGQTVTFNENTPDTLDNIITRVTGGSPSDIDGALQSTPDGHANFYLINPAGVLFGQHARVDVPASLHISTADELRFQSGGLFSATHPDTSTLSMEAPENYGFLGDRSGEIQFLGNGGLDENYSWQGTQIQLQAGNSLDLVGSSLAINATQLASLQGTLRLIAQQGAGIIPINTLPEMATGGALKINHSLVDVSGEGAGLLVLRGGSTNLDNSQLYADNLGDYNAAISKGVDIQASDLLVSNRTNITADSYEKGQAGSINIAVTNGINLLNGGAIGSTALSQGNAGTITVNAKHLTINGQNNSELGTAIYSSTYPFYGNGDDTGNAGQINLNIAGETNLLNRAEINTNTYTQGNAGAITIQTGQLTIDRQGSNEFTGITSSAQDITGNPMPIGNAGQVDITVAKTLNILNEGQINSLTFAQGNAGNVLIKSGNMTIDGGAKANVTGISSSAEDGSTGNAGHVSIEVADTFKILNKGEVRTATFGTGNPGSVTVNAKHITLDGQGYKKFTGISAASGKVSSGDTGNVLVQASDDMHLSNGARISIRNLATINPEKVKPTESTDPVESKLRIVSPILVMDSNSQITAESFGNVAASNIRIDITKWLSINNALITTSVSGSNGDGGNIALNSPVMIMATGFIQANTKVQNAKGGDIDINVNALIPSGSSLITGGNQSYDFAMGKFGNNIIQAAAPLGLSGNVTINSPQLNLSGSLANLTAPQLNLDKLAEDFCASNIDSSLTKMGHGGMLPKAQDSLLTDE